MYIRLLPSKLLPSSEQFPDLKSFETATSSQDRSLFTSQPSPCLSNSKLRAMSSKARSILPSFNNLATFFFVTLLAIVLNPMSSDQTKKKEVER